MKNIFFQLFKITNEIMGIVYEMGEVIEGKSFTDYSIH